MMLAISTILRRRRRRRLQPLLVPLQRPCDLLSSGSDDADEGSGRSADETDNLGMENGQGREFGDVFRGGDIESAVVDEGGEELETLNDDSGGF